MYDKGRENFLIANISWSVGVIKCVLVDTGTYTPVLNTHTHLSDIPAGSRIATSAALTAKTVTEGVADAADVTFTAVTGVSVEALVIYQSSAVTGGVDVAESAQRLIAFIDTATGLPVTPNGGDISVIWDNGINKIFKL